MPDQPARPQEPPDSTTPPPPLSNLKFVISNPQFPLCPGETPRAFDAFMAYFELGHDRTLQAVADLLGEHISSLKHWSAKYRWAARLHSHQTGHLAQQTQARTEAARQIAADWTRRNQELREREWTTAQKLLAAAQCFLESFGDREVEKMTLAQVSRALQVSSLLARQALQGSDTPPQPALSPLQLELAAALKRAYAEPPPQIT